MMRRTVVARLMMLLMGMAVVMLLGGCNNLPGQPTAKPNTSQQNTPQAKATTAPKSSGSRIDQLLNAWTNAGLRAEIKDEINSDAINAMYGCIREYQVNLDDQMVIILEYDLKNLNNTGKSILDDIDKNGTDPRTDEPAWRNQEFVLLNEAAVIENGDVVAEYQVDSNPAREQILEAFNAFK